MAMNLCEKQYTIPWQLIDDDTGTNVGEESIVINVWADASEGLGWDPISHASDIGGETFDSTTFTDSLGRRMLARAKVWFDENKDWIANEEPEFAGYRHHQYAEMEADRAWANRRSL
jgi:hypothetical protein